MEKKITMRENGKTYIFTPGENANLMVYSNEPKTTPLVGTIQKRSKIVPTKYADPEIERRRRVIAKSISQKSKVIKGEYK